jgi:hypothetical protein
VRPDLLQPSLGHETTPQPLYSPRANFFVAFFGGPFALIPFSALNSLRLRRLGPDLPLLLGAAALVVGSVYAMLETSAGAAVAAAVGLEGAPQRAFRLVSRGLALALWGVFHLRHRRFQRSAELWGSRPNPWPAGIACSLLGAVIAVGLVALIGPDLPR